MSRVPFHRGDYTLETSSVERFQGFCIFSYPQFLCILAFYLYILMFILHNLFHDVSYFPCLFPNEAHRYTIVNRLQPTEEKIHPQE